jgi:hypothetical protein
VLACHPERRQVAVRFWANFWGNGARFKILTVEIATNKHKNESNCVEVT